jgi:hypothetical protein
MASPTDSKWSAYAGQEVQGGTSTTPYNQPAIDFGDPMSATVLANMPAINGLLPRVSSVIIHDTMVYEGSLMRIFNRRDDPYGVATEHAIFSTGAANKLNPGLCVPRGSVQMNSQITASNLAWNVPINIYDREINGAVLSESEIQAYVAQKMRTMQKTIRELQFTAAKTMLSDCVPGSRTISSYTASDGTGSSVTMTSTPDGYAGKVNLDTDFTIPEITRGAMPALAASGGYSDVMDAVLVYLQTLEAAASDMRYPGSDYNLLGTDTFSGDRPWLVMETKVINQFDNAIANATTSNGYGYSGFPTKTAREYISRFADLVEIDAFAALPAYDSTTYPTSTDYSGDRLTAVLLDKDAPWLITKFSNMEGQRCAGERMYGYSSRGEQDMAIFKGVNSFVMINDA